MFETLGTGFGIVFILIVIIVFVLMIITLSMSVRLSRLSKKYRLLMKGQDGASLEKAIFSRFKKLDKMTDQGDDMEKELGALKGQVRKTLTHYGIVKYDAFDDVGGKMSFVLAMLDDENTGFILDTIHSKDNCFLYLKEIVKGESYIMLSNEEVDALKQAVSGAQEQDLAQILNDESVG